METSAATLRGFHAHIYFDPDEVEAAQAFAGRAKDRFRCGVGQFHEKPVGPHPRGSCQLSLGDLTIFAHGLSGDDLADHTHHVVWFGASEPLDLSIFD